MTLDIVGAVRARILSDATLVALLADYDGGKAVFAGGTSIPEDFAETLQPFPSIIIDDPTRDEDDSDLTNVARDVDVRVSLYSKPSGSAIDIVRASERTKALFRNVSQASFSTGRLDAASVSGPQILPTEDPSIEGRLLILRLLIREN